MMLAAWFHDLDPFLLRFTETLGIRWYGLSYIAGFLAAWLILSWLARRGTILIKPLFVTDLIVSVVLGTLIGGRLGYVVFYHPDLLLDFRSSAPWWGVLAINEGGMASHGGMIGIVIACWLFARKHKVPPLHVMDCLALVAPVGIFLGRLANFINGELLGRIVAMPGEPAPWWAVRYPQELLEANLAPELDADQESLLAILVTDVAGADKLNSEGLQRVVEAVQRDEAGVAERLAPLISARHPSQLYQAVAEGIIVGLVVWLIFAKLRKPGVVMAWFLIVYGVGRVITELWRLPDAHLAVQRIAGLSRGQWLSVVMVMVGVAILCIVSRWKSERLGGWMRPAIKT